MTRINVVDPLVLTDQHLMAEYRELPMVGSALKRSLRSKKGVPKIPFKYTLNAGHVTYFYNKGGYLKRRYESLILELRKRGYKLDVNREVDFRVFEDNGYDIDWEPEVVDLEVNVERIRERIMAKVEWYKHYGLSIVDREEILNPSVLYGKKPAAMCV